MRAKDVFKIGKLLNECVQKQYIKLYNYVPNNHELIEKMGTSIS